jgi:hypothetical protein
MKNKIVGKDPCDIIKMNQILIPFSIHSSKMLETKGLMTIHIRASTKDTKWVTLAATVVASRKMLPPLLVFKGLPNGCIARHES